MSVEQRLRDLGLELPIVPKPLANYVTVARSGNLLFLSGHLPVLEGKVQYVGKLGKDLGIDDGYQAAKIAALNCLASVKSEVGDLDKVRRIVRVAGFVNCTEGFTDQPKVVNGASDLLSELFGEAGRHSRSAIGVSQLPSGAAVEVEMVVEV